jgi:hypothetical protein
MRQLLSYTQQVCISGQWSEIMTRTPRQHKHIRATDILEDGNSRRFSFSVVLDPDGTYSTGLGWVAPRIPYALRAYGYEPFAAPADSPSGLGGALILVEQSELQVASLNGAGDPNPLTLNVAMSLRISARQWYSQSPTEYNVPLLGSMDQWPIVASPIKVQIVVEYQLP